MSGFPTGTVGSPIRVVKETPSYVLTAVRAWAGPFEDVYVKLLTVNTRSIEAVCAWLALEIGLPVPQPMLLAMQASKMPKGHEWPFGARAHEHCFATRAVPYALPLRNISSDRSGQLIDKWAHLPEAAVFDQLIGNDDRTANNILLGPGNRLWLIDHARSLGGAGERLFSTDPTALNFFLARIAGYTIEKRVHLRPALIAVCTKLASAVRRVPYSALMVPEDISMQIEGVLSRRARILQATVLQAIGLPDLYDNGMQPMDIQ